MTTVALANMGWRPLYQNLLAGFFQGVAEDLLIEVARKVTDAPKDKGLELGSTELHAVLGTPQNALGLTFYRLLKSATTNNAVKVFNSFAPKPLWLVNAQINATSGFMPTKPIDGKPEVSPKVGQSIKEPLAESPNWADHIKITYAYFEATLRLQFENNSGLPKTINGWEFINLLCLQEAAANDGQIDTNRLCQRICAEFPKMRERIGDMPIMQFVLYRSLKQRANLIDMDFFNVAVQASLMVHDCVKDVQKPWRLVLLE